MANSATRPESATLPTGTALPGLGPEAYARWRASDLGALTEHLERRMVLDLVGDVHGRDVLDLGCGDGDLALALAGAGARVVGLDASPAMIAAARARAQRASADSAFDIGNISSDIASTSFDVGSAAALPFPAQCFDLVVAVTILCFVADAPPVFQEIAHVLRPGGRLVICELGRRSLWAVERRVRAWLGSALWRRGHFRTPRELQSLCRQAGLHPGPVRGAIYYPRWTPLARRLAPHDAAFARLGTFGAAFLGLAASKPDAAAPAPGRAAP